MLPGDAARDVQAAMDVLARRPASQRFVLAGLCSGGDIAFQLGLKDPRVAGVVMMNPRTFCVHDLGWSRRTRGARYYQDSLLKERTWLKLLLRGEVDVARAARMVAPKVKGQVVSRAKRAVSSLLGAGVTTAHGEHAENDVPRCLRLMAERGVDTFLVVHGARSGRRLRRRPLRRGDAGARGGPGLPPRGRQGHRPHVHVAAGRRQQCRSDDHASTSRSASSPRAA